MVLVVLVVSCDGGKKRMRARRKGQHIGPLFNPVQNDSFASFASQTALNCNNSY